MYTIKPNTIKKIRTAPAVYISNPVGKMKNIPCVTSSCVCNDFCKRMHTDGKTVCAHCYAQEALMFKTAPRLRYERNTELLSGAIITDHDLPRFYTDIARFETHGDWVNTTHAQNEINIALANPATQFTVWTKRLDLLVKLVKSSVRKPDNLHIKASSPFLNKQGNNHIKQWLGAHGWEVTWFTVCSLDFLLEKYGLDELRTNGDRIITCGGRNCRSCMRCYGAHEKQDVIELLKQDTARAKRLGVKIGGGQ